MIPLMRVNILTLDFQKKGENEQKRIFKTLKDNGYEVVG